MSDTRIVLVKPGDVLMLGNVTIPEDKDALEEFDSALRTLRETLGLAHVCVFEDDIDLAVKPAETRYEVRQQAAISDEDMSAAVRRRDAFSRVGRFI